jgi:phosphoglycolate phosphatase
VPLPFRSAIFDLDGTLVDSLEDIGVAMNRALAELGLAGHSLAAYRGFVGAGVRVLAERAVSPGHHDRLEEAVAAFRRHYERDLVVHTRPYPGVVSLLSALAAQGVPLAVLSNKYDEATQAIVAALLGEVPFAVVQGHRPELPKKPDPTAALAIASRLGAAPADCVFVGDTGIDMATAAAAGMIGVGVRWGFRGDDELRDAGARAIIDRPAELLSLSPSLFARGPA